MFVFAIGWARNQHGQQLATHEKTHALLQHLSNPCNSYDGHSLYQHRCLIICIHQSWFIWCQQLPSVLLVHHACYSLFLQTATVCSQHTCIILLHQTDTALTTQQTVPAWYRQFWTVCRRQQSDTAMISYLYQAWKCNRL